MSDISAAKSPTQLLLDEVQALGVEEILALCYALKNTPERLRLYLDVLRKRSGERAQFASCLICFDLARQGDELAQREFSMLTDTMRGLSTHLQLVESLVGADDYLLFVWELCQAHIADLDPRFDHEPTVVDTGEVASLDLLSDEDFDDFSIDVDTSAMWRKFDEAVEAFLGGVIGMPIYDPTAGFRVASNKDVQRVEKFLQELDSVREYVSLARGFRALTLIFYGTHMRSKSLFGTVNERKQTMLRDGIREFLASADQMAAIAGVLSPLHAPTDVWERAAELLADFTAWIAEDSRHAELGLDAYDPIERLGRKHRGGNRRAGERY